MVIGNDALVYVSDAGGDAVRVLGRDGALVRTIGETPDAPGALRNPLGLAQAADGRLFVADIGNHRVPLFSPNGSFIRSPRRR